MAKDTAEQVAEQFPGATEEVADDFDRQIDKYDGKQRTVAMTGLGDVTMESLKQMTFADLANLPVVDAADVLGGDQYGAILENKDRLIGIPFVILHADFHAGTMGGFVTMYVLTQDEQRYVVNDGSTGIYQQLMLLADGADSITDVVVCKNGLRVSEYDKELPNGSITHAKTYYIEAAQRVR